ncbi:hypothetical protein FQZ97_818150 [compost metagenome]
MQLTQAETFGVFDHHQRGVRHVDTHLDHGGGHQHTHVAAGEERHHRLLLGHRHARVQQTDQHARKGLTQLRVRLGGVGQVQRLALFDQRTYPVDLPPLRHLRADAFNHLVAALVGHDLGHDGRAPGRQLVNGGDVEVGVIAHRQGPRDRGRRHHEHMGLPPIACALRVAAPPLKGQRQRPGKAGSAAFPVCSPAASGIAG